MTKLFANGCFGIDAGQAVSGTAAQARSLRIASGRVWITIEGEQDDYWLGAGDSLTIPAKRLVVIEADKMASRIDFGAARQPAGAVGAVGVVRLGAQLGRLAQRLMAGKSNPAKHAPCGSH